MGGTIASMRGPREPTATDQKKAGFSRADQRQYRIGEDQNRGAKLDIVEGGRGGKEEVESFRRLEGGEPRRRSRGGEGYASLAFGSSRVVSGVPLQLRPPSYEALRSALFVAIEVRRLAPLSRCR